MPAPLRLRVLIVEDVGPCATSSATCLGPAGFEVDTVATATEALDRLATRRYAVIVADCVLPGLPVLDWLAALRGAAPTTPLILCSGTIGEELRR
jgi:DNA-binding response OmpR family regulator